MTAYQVGQLIYYCVAAFVALASITITTIGLLKARKKTRTSEEKAKIDKQIESKAIELIGEAEMFYKELDTVLKQTSSGTESAGKYKKESVLNKLQEFVLGLGQNFDKESWSKRIDELVKFTKDVNS